MLETMYLHLNFTGYKLIKINDLKINHEINEHSKLYISALLDGEKKLDPVDTTKPGTQIKLTNDSRKQPVIFFGMVKTIRVKHLSGVYHIEIEAVSNSYVMDVRKTSRSFQDKTLTYKDMIGELIKEYKGSDFIYKTEAKPIEAFTMQYDETDWEFFKRMASRFNAGLVADHVFDSAKFTFGMPQGDNRGKIEKYNFYIKKNISAFMEASENTNPLIKELDSIEFYVQTEEEFMLGDRASYQDINNLFVKSVEAEMIEGIMLYTYALSTQNGLTKNKIYNEKITGLSLKGVVLEAVKDTVKVRLEIDEKQDAGKAWQFPYTTMYTAEGNAGWYCMPEKDDTVFIYFPNNEERNGVGVNSIRESGGVDNPEVKIFRTANGKELKFSPEEILITCVDEDIFIRLNEKSGIEIISSKPVKINTDSNMSLEAKKKIDISANDQIELTCKGSSIKLSSNVDIKGSLVKIN